MRYGMNLLLWADTLTDEALPLLDEIKEIGFDAVELPVFEVGRGEVRQVGQAPRRRGPRADRRDRPRRRRQPDEPRRRRSAAKASRRTRRRWTAARRPACEAMVGPFHSALGYFSGAGPTKDEWNWAVESMREVAEHADKCGVTLGLEYLNRFECYLLNTAADGARFCRDVDHPRCQMMYDTFHSHIEEKNTPAAIRALKDCLAHVHISENDRSTPGLGQRPLGRDVRRAAGNRLRQPDGDRGLRLALEKLIPATKIWRRMYDSERQLAADGLRFMKAEVAKRR